MFSTNLKKYTITLKLLAAVLLTLACISNASSQASETVPAHVPRSPVRIPQFFLSERVVSCDRWARHSRGHPARDVSDTGP